MGIWVNDTIETTEKKVKTRMANQVQAGARAGSRKKRKGTVLREDNRIPGMERTNPTADKE